MHKQMVPIAGRSEGVGNLLTVAAESYKLPISAPRDQGESDLCWVYTTLSLLETNSLQTHLDSTISLSRAAVQRESVADRFRRLISGDSNHLEDGGIAVDALKLIRTRGLAADKDFHDVVDPDPIYESISQRLSGLAGQAENLKALATALDDELGPRAARNHARRQGADA